MLYCHGSPGRRGEVGGCADVVVGVDGVVGVTELGGDDEWGVLEFDCLVVVVGVVIDGSAHVVKVGGGVLGELVVSDIGESGTTDDGVVMGTEVMLLMLLPFVVVGLVVDVERVGCVVVQLLEQRRRLSVRIHRVSVELHQRVGTVEEGGFGDRMMFEADEHLRGRMRRWRPRSRRRV